MKKLLTLCLLIATNFATNAQDRVPTKEETIKWLIEAITNNLDTSTKDEANIRLTSIDECTFIYAYDEIFFEGNNKYYRHYEVVCPTGGADKIDDDGFLMFSNGGVVKTALHDRRQEYIDATWGLKIANRDTDIRYGILAALDYLSTFCTNKKE